MATFQCTYQWTRRFLPGREGAMLMISKAEQPASASRRQAALRSPRGEERGGSLASAAASLIHVEKAFSDLALPYLVSMNAGPSFRRDFRNRASSLCIGTHSSTWPWLFLVVITKLPLATCPSQGAQRHCGASRCVAILPLQRAAARSQASACGIW